MTADHPEEPGRVPVGELRELLEMWDEISTYDEMPDGQRAIFAVCAKELRGVVERYE